MLLIVHLIHSKCKLAQASSTHGKVILVEMLLAVAIHNWIAELVHHFRVILLCERLTKLVSFLLTIASGNWIAELVMFLTKISGVRITVLV